MVGQRAKEKVKQLAESYPLLFEQNRGTSMRARSGVTSSLLTTSTDNLEAAALDLASVIKASQAISGEMVLEQFWQTTLAILIENAGAERGRLVVRQSGKLEVHTSEGRWLDGLTPIPPEELPHAILAARLQIWTGNRITEHLFEAYCVIE